MWCNWVPMAWELKTGSMSGSRNTSLWSTTRMPGAEVSSHAGVWPSVTMYTFLRNGAYMSKDRREYLSSSWLV